MPYIPPDRQSVRPEPEPEPEPIFVDGAGQRRRLTVLAGVSIGAGLLVSLALIVAGLFTDATAPLPGWTDPQHQQDVAENPDAPTTSAPASPTTSNGTTQVPRTVVTTAAPTGSAPATGVPGQGDDHRNTPVAKPTRTPRRPPPG